MRLALGLAAIALGWSCDSKTSLPSDLGSTHDLATLEAGLAADAGRDRPRREASPDLGASDRGLRDLARADRDRPDAEDTCAAAKTAVEHEMARINTCTQDSDCASLPGSCPFGCHIPFAKTESTATLSALIAAYQAMKQCPQCAYKCSAPGSLHCPAKVCVMTYR